MYLILLSIVISFILIPLSIYCKRQSRFKYGLVNMEDSETKLTGDMHLTDPV